VRTLCWTCTGNRGTRSIHKTHRAARTLNDTQKTSLRVFESLNNTRNISRHVFKSSNNTRKTLCRVFKSSVNKWEPSRRVKNRHGEAATRSIRGRSIGSLLYVWCMYTHTCIHTYVRTYMYVYEMGRKKMILKKPVPSYVKFRKRWTRAWMYVGSRPHKPSEESVNLNMQTEQIMTSWRKCEPRSRNTNSNIRFKAVKPENFCRIQNRARSFTKVDNLWSKHLRNDAREANTWKAGTHTQAAVRGSRVLQSLSIQWETSLLSHDKQIHNREFLDRLLKKWGSLLTTSTHLIAGTGSQRHKSIQSIR
jgi:hypothetical protein